MAAILSRGSWVNWCIDDENRPAAGALYSWAFIDEQATGLDA